MRDLRHAGRREDKYFLDRYIPAVCQRLDRTAVIYLRVARCYKLHITFRTWEVQWYC
jgi:hypothetical protein